jgi:hypothetical protein
MSIFEYGLPHLRSPEDPTVTGALPREDGFMYPRLTLEAVEAMTADSRRAAEKSRTRGDRGAGGRLGFRKRRDRRP